MLVIGACATAGSTLAAWTDDEVAGATVTAGTFTTEGSVNGTTYTSTTAAAPGKLTFSAGATAMLPGSYSYAPFSIKTTQDSTAAGAIVQISSTATGSTAGEFRQSIAVVSAPAQCTAASFPTSGASLLVTDASLTTTASNLSLALAAKGGSPVTLCLKVGLPAGASNDAQGATAATTWTFSAQAGS